ncbi:MAG: glycosyl hydrolase [Myxococcales bacterium]|nr:glycosyl hydrolase [Myxococcales bacterium]
MKQLLALSLALAGCGGDPSADDMKGSRDGGGGGGDLSLEAVRSCTTVFRYTPESKVVRVSLGGEWNGFDPSKTEMTGPDQAGAWSATVKLPEGAYGYKIVIGVPPDLQWILDPQNPFTKHVGGTENSLIEVEDCNAPLIVFGALTKTADGKMHAEARYVDGAGMAGADPAKVGALLDGAKAAATFDAATGLLKVDATGLASDKHRLVFTAADRSGKAAADLHLPFWIEKEPFDFRDGMMYFAFTDRFKDGDPKNNAPAADTDPRANYGGGDFAGIRQTIEAGYFDALGVRTLWISPPFPNPDHWEPGADKRHYSGYHGYWPVDGRSTQKRFGDLAAMRAMVAAAHQHGIRVLVDTVLNHVHREHPYFLDHKNDGWFNGDGGCVCGGNNCDWDTHRLDCWFTNYLPDVNYENFAALSAMIEDALFWAREVDVDGFRVDAVKHFPHAVSRLLRGKLRERFEQAGPLYYLVGETFTGGDDGGRQLIKSYLGKDELHAQFDFPLYWNMVGAFATNSQSLRDLEGAAGATDAAYGDAPMSPFFGNHDVSRFLSAASGMLWKDEKEQAWQMPPPVPADDVPYQKLRLALTFLYGQPGVPLLYYGDEFGLPGAGDPDNRRMMKWSGLSSSEQKTLDRAKQLGAARRELVALRRGKRYTLWVDDDLYVFARAEGSDVAVVALNRAGSARTQAVPVRAEAPLPDGTILKDRLGGPAITVAGGKILINLGARASAVLAK